MTQVTVDQALEIAMQHHRAGQLSQAETIYRQILSVVPNHPDALHLLGAMAQETGQSAAAIDLVNRAIAIRPAAEFFNTLGNALRDQNRLDEAVANYQKAISLKPNYPHAHNNLGTIFITIGRPDDAIECFTKAIAGDPNYAEAHTNLGRACADRGRLDDAFTYFRKSISLNPASTGAHDNFVYLIHFHPGYDARKILEENRRWAKKFESPLAREIRPHANNRDPERRLKIGYVSPDFRAHAAASFLLPLLANHNSQNVEVHCYASIKCPDATTARMKQFGHVWRDCVTLSDVQLTEKIREDQIDILVDLTLHMADNRLLVFARKPAPVQVTWLGYPSTTGMKTIDYRLSDPHLDPPGMGNEPYTEKTIRMSKTFWCYQPSLEKTPEVNELPALKNGYITFGCFNNFAKVTPSALELWKRVLDAVHNSRLILQTHIGRHRDDVQKLLGSRVEFVTVAKPWEYLSYYHRVDLCLDPIPCPGHTSSLDALWMGVPTITLSGNTAISRGGASIFTNVGLSDFIASSKDQYVSIAAAVKVSRLATLRTNLRAMLQASPLMNARQFAADLESVYRDIWHTWSSTTPSDKAR